MTRRFLLAALLGAVLLGAVLVATPRPAVAHDFRFGDITISHPWIRLNLADRPSAAYFVIVNHGSAEDRLIAASSPAFGRVEIHAHVTQDGVMSMMRLDGVTAPGHGVVAFEASALHLMLFEPIAALAPSGEAALTLSFETAGDVEVQAIVVGLGQEPAAEDGAHADEIELLDATN